ncbi:hypothetical protein SIN8267_02748 [Sinobacterium norvegicum]|uniref:DUF1456 family protein n=1 Tax=Sinobacterium norvegicum TaxID=1641715 RepID=A0ABM9AHC4_9GAMM|nr:DUF1456 family protein [Sinobacterium norvegicum]CAH0992615.1 hypothetical protein SIN8267_02748 [Sinobacterium norvegicum]
MTNNDVLRRLRYCFNLGDDKMIAIFAQAELVVSRAEVSRWLKKEEDEDYQNCSDVKLATFLNGFINLKRGKRDGDQPQPESRLNNNIILRKLKIALNFTDEDILAALQLAGLSMSKHELSAFFRKPGHKHYRECKDQVLRNFIKGLQLKYRPEDPSKKRVPAVEPVGQPAPAKKFNPWDTAKKD